MPHILEPTPPAWKSNQFLLKPTRCRDLGPLSFHEVAVLVVFCLLVLLWFFRFFAINDILTKYTMLPHTICLSSNKVSIPQKMYRFRFKGSLDLSLGGLQRYNGYVDVERIFLFLSSFHYFHFITSLKTLSVCQLWLPLDNWLGLCHSSHCYSPICYSCRSLCFTNLSTI